MTDPYVRLQSQTEEVPMSSTAVDLRVAVVVGSVRDGRFGARIGAWVHKCLAESTGAVDVIDLAELTFPPTMGAHPDVASFATRIGLADGVVVVTPEYNHSFPGPLKTAIDAVRGQWRAKPVGFVCYGGLSGGLRAVEALRPVFAELHAVTIRDTVSLHNPWAPADDPSVDYPDSAAAAALKQMIKQLWWWADATRTALRREPYPV
jgi:NAD(P)H-dependent FMN reductase